MAVQADPLLQNVLKAFGLIGWGVPSQGNLSELIKKLLVARTDLDPFMLILVEAQLTGSVYHRLQDPRTGHGGSVCILPNYGTFFCFDIFPLTEYSKGSKNMNLMFQSLMSYVTPLISWGFALGWEAETLSIYIHIRKSCCIIEVNEQLIECSDPPPPRIYKYSESPYLYTHAKDYLQLKSQKIFLLLDADLAKDPLDFQIRLINLVSEEIFSLLSPYT